MLNIKYSKMNPTESSVLNAFDFTAIEEMDPSLGSHLITYISYILAISL